MKISREFKNSGISFSSIDTTKSSRDPYIVPFNFICQHRCELERVQKRALSMKSILPFLKGDLCSRVVSVGADFPFTFDQGYMVSQKNY